MYKAVACAILVLILPVEVSGLDFTWTGEGGDNRWDNPENWNYYGIPGPDDNVWIPPNTPECQITGTVYVNSIRNDGSMGSQPGAPYVEVGTYVHFDNYGTISTGENILTIAPQIGDVNNSGLIEGGKVFIVANDYMASVNNQAGGEIRGYGSQGNVYIEAFTVANNGTIRGGEATTGHGGNVNIRAVNSCTNNGAILGGDAHDNSNGGSVSVTSTGDFSNSGRIRSGNGGGDAGKDGTVVINADKIDNYGTIKGGTTGEGQGGSRPYRIGSVTIVADSLDIHPDTSYIEADTLIIMGRKLRVYDINNYDGIWTASATYFFTTPEGIADFSGTHQASAIVSAAPDGYNHIYSDTVLAPPEGLNTIFLPEPDTFPSDTTIIRAFIDLIPQLSISGDTDTMEVWIQNQSMTSKLMEYNMSSAKGWLSSVSGSTALLAPFAFERIPADYTIPGNAAAGESDTVRVIINIGTSFADTAYGIITALGGTAVDDPGESRIPGGFALLQNYPNPFNLSTTIRYDLPEATNVAFKIYNILGQEVRTLVNEEQTSGEKIVVWDGRNNEGKPVASGIYICRITAGGKVKSREMMLLK